MIQNDEAASPRPARGTGVGDCVKCGTSYSSKVEFVQHLLLHIERTYPVVTLDRADVVKFEGATDHKDKMSAEGELKEEMDQVDEVKVETKPKLNNNFEIHADSNNLSSTKDGERSGSVSGDDDSMSMCSSTGMPANAPSDAPKMVVKAEVHIPKNEVAKSEEEANGRRSSESSQGKDQSGAEDEDDGKTSDGSKSPAKPTTPSLPFAITLRKSEDLMAQTNYNLIQKRLQQLYDKCQGTRMPENQPTVLNQANARVSGCGGPSVVSSLDKTGVITSRDRNDPLRSLNQQESATHPSCNVGETQDGFYDSTPKLSECGTESSGEIPLTPTANAEIDAVLKDLDFSRLPDQMGVGVDSDNDMNLHITPEDCDWPEEIEEEPNKQEEPEVADEPIPPPALIPKKIGPKPKISDYFIVTRKSCSNSKSPSDDTQFLKKQPSNAADQFSQRKKDNLDDDSNFRSMGVKISQEAGKNCSKAGTSGNRFTSFEAVLDDVNKTYDELVESEFHLNRSSTPETNVEDNVLTGCMRKSSLNISSDAGFRDPRTSRATTVSKQTRTDSTMTGDGRWERIMSEDAHRNATSNVKGQKIGELKPVMTDRCGVGGQNSMKSAEFRQLKPILTDITVKRGIGQMGNPIPSYQNRRDGASPERNPLNRLQSSMAADIRDNPNVNQDLSNSAYKDSQNYGTNYMGEIYGQVMRKLGHGISLSVVPSKNSRGTADEDMRKQAFTHQGMTEAVSNQEERFQQGGNIGKGQSNIGVINSSSLLSAGNAQTRPPSKIVADSSDDSNLHNEATSNPEGKLSQLDGTSVDAQYDQDVRNSGFTSDQEVQKQASACQGLKAADRYQRDRFRRGGRNVGKGQTNNGVVNPEGNAQTRRPSKTAAYSCDDSNLYKEATSNPEGKLSQLDDTSVDALYDQDVRRYDKEVQKQASACQGLKAADRYQKDRFQQGGGNVSKAQSNNGVMNSKRNAQTRPPSKTADDSNLYKKATSNPERKLSQLDGSCVDAQYDQDVPRYDEEVQKQASACQGLKAADRYQRDRFQQGGGNVGKAQSNNDVVNSERNAQTRPPSKTADDSSLYKEATSNPEGNLSQLDGTSVAAQYDQDVRNPKFACDQEMQKQAHQGLKAAGRNQRDKFRQGEGNVGKAHINRNVNSGRIAQTQFVAADSSGDFHLHKDATSNPRIGGDYLFQLDNANVISGYDRNTRISSHEISLTTSVKSPCMMDQGMQDCSQNLIDQSNSKKCPSAVERNIQNHPQPSMASNFKDGRNPGIEANAACTVGQSSLLDTANAIAGYDDQDARNLSREISMSLPESMNTQPLTTQEIDDLIASALQGRSGAVITKDASVNQQHSILHQSNPKKKPLSDDLKPKSTELEHQGPKRFVEPQNAFDKHQRRQQTKPANSANRPGDVAQNQKARKSNPKKVPRRKPMLRFGDEDPVFEAQPATDSSSGAGSQSVPPAVNRRNPALVLGDLQEYNGLESDSSISEIKIPDLPAFFEAFPSMPASVVGKKFAETVNKDGGQPGFRSQDATGTSQAGSGASHPTEAASKVFPKVPKVPMKHQLPPVAPTPGAAPRMAIAIQSQNKGTYQDREWRMRRRRMYRRAEMRRKKISLKLSKHLPNATQNTKQKHHPMLTDTDSSDSFEVKKKSKWDGRDLVRSSGNLSDKAGEREKPQDFLAGLLPILSPPKPLTPVCVSTSSTFTPEKSYTYLQPLDSSFYQDPPENSENPSHPYPSQEDFPNGEFHGPQKELYRCALCPRSFATAAELDAHAAADGHIICSMSEACASLSFSSSAALSHHQAMVHQAPAQTTAVQRLAAQVERLPQTFGSYPPQVPPQPYGGPSPYNHPPTSYNGPKLGSQVVLTPMSAVVVQAPQPPPNLPNLPGIQVTKRPAPPPVDSSPSKMNRGDDGMPSIRLPDSITLVKSQPAPPPQNAVADMLATRGITMVASGSRSGPTPATSLQPVAPAKRLPNVPSAISIVPSRPQPAQQAQRFAVPPAPPQQRGRHITNLGTVDLTREDQNGRMRGGPGRPIIPNSPRRFSCTICDKVYPTGESLQAHMAVHGSNKPGRYMCEICRVVYTNEAKLQHHKKTVHAVRAPADTEMVIPICDINQPGVKEKLLQCGIRHVVQVQSVRNANDTAAFGLPIIPIDLARNEAYSRLDDLGASNILSLGSLRNIYR